MDPLQQIDKCKLPCDTLKLLQPDLLTVNELIHILQERGVDSILLVQDKEMLVSLFKRVALPLPQREFRKNHRGLLLMNLREKLESAKISNSSETTIDIRLPENSRVTQVPDNREMDKIQNRLKPPPSAINFEHKKIKLNSIEKTKRTNDLDQIVIKKKKISEGTESNPDKIETQNGESLNENVESKNGKTTVPKKVSLKRNFSSQSQSSTTETNSQVTEKPALEPDKKRKPITWP